MSSIAADRSASNSVPGQGRWRIGLGILTVAMIAQAALWRYFDDDRTYSKMSVLFVWPAALFLLAIWWTFFSGHAWKVRLGVWGLIAGTFAVLWAVFAFDGVDGEMVPRFRYRWEKSAKQETDAFFAGQPSAAPAVNAAISADDAAEPLAATEGDWPGFRGPRRDGIATGVTLRRDWDARPPKELWRKQIGLGWSGFSIVGEFAFTQEQRGPQECVVCYRVDDGSQVWLHGDDARLDIVEANGGAGPHATPQFHEGLLYTQGGTGLLNCLDARTGRKLWQRNILKDAGQDGIPVEKIQWGMSGTPLVVDNLVITNPGGEQKRSTIAYNRLSGEIVWAAGNYPAGYASPHFATIHSVPQAMVFHGKGIAGHDLADGRELWNIPWVNDPLVNSAQPIVFDDGSVMFGCSYGVGSARYDILREADNSWQTRQRWKTNKFRPKFNDFVLKDGFVYGLDDGIMTCIDVETGKTKWKSGRYGYGQLLLVDDLLLILSEQGELALVEAQPKGFVEVAKIGALDPICWNHLALSRGKLLVRNSHTAACYDVE